MTTASFGYWLRRRRKALDLTQAELADLAGCALDTIKKIETDARRPSRQLAERLAGCLQLAPDERDGFVQAARAERAVDTLPIAGTPPNVRVALEAGRLLEREVYLRALDESLAAASAGDGRMVFVAGEAGAGKSALVRAFGAGATARLLVGACDPLAAPRPLGPLLDIAASLGPAFQQLLEDASQRDQAFRSFLAALHEDRRPTLAIFEDVHWADEATLDLLRFLGRRIGDAPALLVVTYRDDELGPAHPLRVVLGDLATARHVRRFSLPPLSVQAVRALADGSGLDPDTLHRQTGGNPFFVAEVLASKVDGIPPTVFDAVLARASRLGPGGRAALEAAAVIGSRAEPWLFDQVAGPAAEHVEACLASGMLRQQDNLIVFRHELARQAILDALSPRRAVALHQAALRALQATGAGPGALARLAYHAEAAGDRQAVLEHAPAAARRAAALNAHRQAAAQFERALRFADGLPPAEHARLLEEYAHECNLIDRRAEGIAARRQALELWRLAGDGRKRGENLAHLVIMLSGAGRTSEAEHASRAAIETLEALPPGRELALAYRAQAALRMFSRDLEAAIAWGQKAIALADNSGDAAIAALAHNTVGTAWLFVDYRRGCAYLEERLTLARAAGRDADVANAYNNLGAASAELYQLQQAERYLSEGIAFAAERDFETMRLYMLAWLALTYLLLGRWAEALDAATTVLSRPGVSAISRIVALLALGRLHARRGNPGAANALDGALELARQADELQRLAPVRATRAEAAWLKGDRLRALAEAEAAYDLALQKRHSWLAGELGFWRWRAGAEVTLPAWAARPFALQVAGAPAAAADEWRRLGCPYEAARALADCDNRPALEQALAEFERMGAQPDAAAVARRLRDRAE